MSPLSILVGQAHLSTQEAEVEKAKTQSHPLKPVLKETKAISVVLDGELPWYSRGPSFHA